MAVGLENIDKGILYFALFYFQQCGAVMFTYIQRNKKGDYSFLKNKQIIRFVKYTVI